MAINIILADAAPMVMSEIACTQDSPNISIPSAPPTVDFCYCDIECEYEEKKFASPGNEAYKNDLSYLLEEAVDDAGTIVFKLYKNAVLVGSIVDDTYGTFFAKGSITGHLNKSGFIVSWEKIYGLLGVAQYHFVIEVTNFSRLITKETQKYKLQLFDEECADQTAVIKTTQNGEIQGGLDYTGMNWGLEFRVPGKLIYGTPEFESNTYLTSNRVETQIQDHIINTFSFECDFIPSIISRQLIENSMLSNEFVIMDYNLFNDASLIYQDKTLYPSGVEEVEYFARSQNGLFTFSFTDRQKNLLKRNFK